jgi:DNA-binding transcriptional ArsR family regulator
MYFKCTVTSIDVVFKAIAHPVRRKIIGMLSDRNCSVKQLTSAFAITQPAVSQHLRDLKKAKLVTSKKVGLEQIYRLTGEPIKIVFNWSSQYRSFFDPSGHAWSIGPLNDGSSGQRSSRRGDHGG